VTRKKASLAYLEPAYLLVFFCFCFFCNQILLCLKVQKTHAALAMEIKNL